MKFSMEGIINEENPAELQKFMGDYKIANKIIIPCRSSVDSEYNSVKLDTDDSRRIFVQELFSQLGLKEDFLKEIYEFKNLQYTGRFTENGKQKLANILQKKITFYDVKKSDDNLTNPEIFHPLK